MRTTSAYPTRRRSPPRRIQQTNQPDDLAPSLDVALPVIHLTSHLLSQILQTGFPAQLSHPRHPPESVQQAHGFAQVVGRVRGYEREVGGRVGIDKDAGMFEPDAATTAQPQPAYPPSPRFPSFLRGQAQQNREESQMAGTNSRNMDVLSPSSFICSFTSTPHRPRPPLCCSSPPGWASTTRVLNHLWRGVTHDPLYLTSRPQRQLGIQRENITPTIFFPPSPSIQSTESMLFRCLRRSRGCFAYPSSVELLSVVCLLDVDARLTADGSSAKEKLCFHGWVG
ncbi:hypothetical protein ONZ45_g9546 [Pleurotus djamor]|nr:hypothetical protein ONZ45_g9546 [Pleurotus djamor]